MSGKNSVQNLIPVDVDEFFQRMRQTIREEVRSVIAEQNSLRPSTPGLSYRPLYDMKALRHLFMDISRSTVYEWIRVGKLTPLQMNGRGKVFLLWADVERLWLEQQKGGADQA